MNLLKKLAGKAYLKFRNAGLALEVERYKAGLAKCGNNVRIGNNCKMIPSNISIGNNVVIGEGSHLMAVLSHIYIGDNVVTGPNLIIRGGTIELTLLVDILLTSKMKKNALKTMRT